MIQSPLVTLIQKKTNNNLNFVSHFLQIHCHKWIQRPNIPLQTWSGVALVEGVEGCILRSATSTTMNRITQTIAMGIQMPNRAGSVASGGGSPMGKSSPKVIMGGINAVMRNPDPRANAATLSEAMCL